MKICLIGLAILVGGPLAWGEMREWKTADGTKTLMAEYVRSGDGTVTILRQRDRRTFTLDLAKLSDADRAWVTAREAELAESGVGDGEGSEADPALAELLTGEWERHEGHDLKYRIFGERKMRRAKDDGYPLVVYLHGRGGDVMSPNEPWQANSFTAAKNYRKRPCFVIAPQNPDQEGWNGKKADGVVKIVEELIKGLPIDENRIYVTGYSMGGFGTFQLLADEPKLFAAGVPVAGGGNPGSASNFKEVPVWVFHGAKDPTVPVSMSQRMVEALKDERAEVKYTEYPDGDHGIGGKVYADEEMHEWLFAQSRK